MFNFPNHQNSLMLEPIANGFCASDFRFAEYIFAFVIVDCSVDFSLYTSITHLVSPSSISFTIIPIFFSHTPKSNPSANTNFLRKKIPPSSCLPLQIIKYPTEISLFEKKKTTQHPCTQHPAKKKKKTEERKREIMGT